MNEWQGSAAGSTGARADLADRARQVVDVLRAELHATGACWGADEPGTAFAQLHASQAGQLLDRLEAVPARLHGSADRDDRG